MAVGPSACGQGCLHSWRLPPGPRLSLQSRSKTKVRGESTHTLRSDSLKAFLERETEIFRFLPYFCLPRLSLVGRAHHKFGGSPPLVISLLLPLLPRNRPWRARPPRAVSGQSFFQWPLTFSVILSCFLVHIKQSDHRNKGTPG